MRPAEHDEVPDAFSRILDDAVAHIVEHEDAESLFDWLSQRLERADARELFEIGAGERTAPIAHTIGRALWNVMPLPGNDFRPKPLPVPGRNEPCFCGSGQKFKRCCGRLTPPPLDRNVAWTLLLPRLPDARRRNAIRGGQAPIRTLVGLAMEQEEAGKPKKALEYLEPVFDEGAHGVGDDYDHAFTLLLDLYDAVGYSKKKPALLDRVIRETRKSPLRSGALQRRAAVKIDAGDVAGAWSDFRSAQRDDPDSPALGALEVQMLLAEHRLDDARARARFWAGRLRRQGWPDDGGLLTFLEAAARDPEQAMLDLGFRVSGDVGRGLAEWLPGVAGRPVPDYIVSRDLSLLEDDRETLVAESLRQMGADPSMAGALLADLEAELDAADDDADHDDDDDHDGDMPPEPDYGNDAFLRPPQALAEVEEAWRGVFPVAKPFSVYRGSPEGEDAWDPDREEEWTAFLRSHPAAFDSLDILDDLATAIESHPQRDMPGAAEKLQAPLLRRARDIVEHALPASMPDRPVLRWSWTENRPALRSLVRLAYVRMEAGEERAGIELAKYVLTLNPDDNHGLRQLVMNALLRDGEDEAALALSEEYPQDLNADVPFGRVLALYRLGRLDEAGAALALAVERLPKIPRFLTAARVRKPKMDAIGVRLGGDDQAYDYREEMRDVWAATPGALEWLRRAAREA